MSTLSATTLVIVTNTQYSIEQLLPIWPINIKKYTRE
jgi:hypothetical protein